MADRTVKVNLVANASQYIAGMKQAAAYTSYVGSEAEKLSQKREAFSEVGAAAVGFGAATLAAAGLAVKAAIDWESAWTGVTKTVDGSAAQMDALEGELRGLATTLPATHQEIAAVAEAAGQLGVKREDVAAFTKTMVDLGETTNLTADEAATSIAQLMNVMGTAPDQVDNLGASLVALGNDGASTERDIIQMAQRIAGAGKVIGLSEGEVMGFANALASAGIEVEAGGSAISRIMTDIAQSVSAGGDKLDRFAEVAGMSADDFALAFKEGPADAIATFIEGLGGVNEAGGDVFGTLSELGQTDIRVSQALLGMANSGDLLRKSLELGNQAWKDNTALQTEAEKRYATTEAQLQIMSNRVNDAAINFGSVFLPAVANVADAIGSLSDLLAGMPPAWQGVFGVLTVGTGVIALVGGAALLAVPKIAQFKVALDTLNVSGTKTGRVLGGVTKGLGLLAAGAAVVSILDAIGKSGEKAALGLEGITKALNEGDVNTLFDDLGGIGDALDTVFSDSLDANLNRFGSTLNKNLFGGTLADNVQKAEDRFRGMGDALAGMVSSGDGDRAAEIFEELANAAALSGVSTDELLNSMPAYKDALAGVANEARDAADANEGNAEQLAVLQGAATAATDEITGLAEAIRGFGSATLDTREASREFQAALDELTDSVATNGATLDTNTEQGRANEAALDNIAKRALEVSAATLEQTGSQEQASAAIKAGRDELIKSLGQFGITGQAAEDYADKLGLIPGNVPTAVTLTGVGAAEQALIDLTRTRTAVINVRANLPDLNGAVSGSGRMGTFAEGGYTGAGGKHEPAGIVHRGEWVSTAQTVANPDNRRALEYMHRGGVIRGYAGGGYVVPPSRYEAAPQSFASLMRGASAGLEPVNVQVELVPSSGAEQFVDARIRVNGREQHMSVRAKKR